MSISDNVSNTTTSVTSTAMIRTKRVTEAEWNKVLRVSPCQGFAWLLLTSLTLNHLHDNWYQRAQPVGLAPVWYNYVLQRSNTS